MPTDRTYKVLALTMTLDADPEDPVERAIYADLGTHNGHDAKAAIEVALSAVGLPEGTTLCVGIPASNWNEHDVEPDPRPQFKVTPRREASTAESGS